MTCRGPPEPFSNDSGTAALGGFNRQLEISVIGLTFGRKTSDGCEYVR